MKTLSEIPLDAIQQLQGFAFDVDDTLTRDGAIEGEALDALYRLEEGGLQRVLITGRPLGWVDVFARVLPVDLAIGENGAGWIFRASGSKHVFEEGYFASAEDRQKHQEVMRQITQAVGEHMPHVIAASDQRARRCDLAFDIHETVQLSQTDIEQLVGIIESFGAKAPTSSVHAHAICGEWNKAQGLLAATRDAFGQPLDPTHWIFVGDSPNDESAFAHFPYSVGVANVQHHVDRLNALPKFVTHKDRGRGFAELVDYVLARR